MIEVMISSTVSDLVADRAAVRDTLMATGLIHVVGIEPVVGPALAGSAYLATTAMARDCHLYVLILGRRYGFISAQGTSATEIEYAAAYGSDPTKILVFRKKVVEVEERQADFVRRVSEYHKGYYVREYENAESLESLALLSLRQWIEERAALGKGLQYFDHFIRLAIQQSPFPGVRPTYEVADDYVELKYRFLAKSYTIHFEKRRIYNDFWGCLASLKSRFAEWSTDDHG